MRHQPITGLIFSLSIVASANAQAPKSFEGKLGIKIGQGSQTQLLSTLIKGDRALISIPQPSGEVRMLIDGSARTMTILTSLNGQGLKLTTPMEKDSSPKGGPVTLPKKLTTSQTVAGLKCDDYRMEDSTTACLTSGLGKIFLPSSNNLSSGLGGLPNLGGGNSPMQISAVSKWADGLPDNLFPLKAMDKDRKVVYEVTSITRQAVSDASFEVPAGYTDMGETLRNLQNMMRQGGRGRGGRSGPGF